MSLIQREGNTHYTEYTYYIQAFHGVAIKTPGSDLLQTYYKNPCRPPTAASGESRAAAFPRGGRGFETYYTGIRTPLIAH